MITAAAFGTTILSSGTSATLDLGFALSCACWGFFVSRRFRHARGVSPWHIPAIVWAAICFFLQPLGVVVEFIAEITTRNAMASVDGNSGIHSFPPPSTPPVIAADAQSELPARPTNQPHPPNDGSGKAALFGWYKDPTGRHETRYWDGRYWNEHVYDGEVLSTDPLTETDARS